MKQKFLLLLATLLAAVTASAHDFAVENADGKTIYYQRWSSTYVAVTYSGVSDEYQGDIVIPDTVTVESGSYAGTYTVTGIFNSAFHGCTGLTSVSIPASVTRIDESAFDGCTSLKSVELKDGTGTINYYDSSIFRDCPIETVYIGRNLSSYSSSSPFSDKSKSTLTEVIIGENVTEIRDLLFSGCTGLTSITIPDAVTSIGGSAFSGCIGLTSITIPDAVTSIGGSAFSGCTGLTSITIPDGVTSIGGSAFSGCTGLTSITIPDAVTSIGGSAFSGCTGLTSITIPDAVTSIGDSAFRGCTGLTSITIPDALTSIESGTFSGCTGLTSITIPAAVTSIGGGAFDSCTSLRSVEFSDATTTITLPLNGGYGLFYDCPIETVYIGRTLSNESPRIFNGALTEVTIGENVTAICDWLFSKCTGLTSVKIPDSVTSIGNNAFYECSGLTSVKIPDSVTSIGDGAFVRCTSLTTVNIPDAVAKIGSGIFYECSGLTSIIIPDAVTSIGSEAFYGCSSLTAVNIPDAVTSIGSKAFSGCTSLTSVNIGDAVTSIGSEAFRNCASLTAVNIPDGVTSIGASTFQDCYSLEEVSLGEGVASVGDNAFANCTSLLGVDIKGTITSLSNTAWKEAYPVFTFRSLTPGVYGYNSCPLTVPHDAVEAYRKAWPDYMVNIVDVALPISYEINTSARNDESDIVKKVLAVAQAWDRNLTDAMLQVLELKITGTINSYDIMALHNKAINLKKLDLSEAQIVANSYEYYQGLPSVDNEVGKYFLYNMRNLVEVWLPNSATCINGYSVNLCPNLKKIVIGNQTTELRDYAFSGCSTISAIDIPESVLSIGDYAFENCSGLISMHTGVSTQHVGDYAFKDCKSLTSLTIGDATTSLGYSLCERCRNLQSVEIGENARIGMMAFSECSALKSVTMGDNVTFTDITDFDRWYYVWDGRAFKDCTSLEEVTLPKNLERIPVKTFENCSKLKTVHFSPKLVYINEGAFQNCSSLTAAILPTTLQQIGRSAFSGCTKLSEVKIPASITVIGDYAFDGTNIDDIYTWTIEPTNINQNTFPISIFTTALLHVPATANKLYYYDTQWSQFLRIGNFYDPYEYFYLTNKDLIIDYETSRLQGLYDETTGIWKYSDADLGAGSAIMVEGEEPQYLGNVRIICDGKNSTAIIGGNSSETESGANLNIDNLVIEMNITKNKWYFYCFPFEIDYDMMQYDGQYVWRYYDGAKRAANGSGGWTNVTDRHLNAMQGYIFQGSVDGTLTITVPNVAIDGTDKGPQIYTYVSANSHNASWNLVGNPNIGYYAVNDLDYEAPLTTWNGSTYEAFRPGDEDDDVTLHPYQAFFVQTPQSQDTSDPSGLEERSLIVEFDHDNYMTRNQSLDPNFQHKVAKRRAKRHAAKSDRALINLVLATDTVIDRTRVVFNNDKSMGYEIGCDAAKFISDQVAQIYTVDSDGNQYSINERPTADYIVKLGFTAPSAGTYTIRASRSDVVMEIYDVKAHKSALLTEGYTFTAGKGVDNDRFILRLPYGTSGVEGIDQDVNSDREYYGIDGINYGHTGRDGFMIEKRGTSTRKVYNR